MSDLSAEEIADIIERIRDSDFVEVRVELPDIVIAISRHPDGLREGGGPVSSPASRGEAAEPPPAEPRPMARPGEEEAEADAADGGSADGLVTLRSPVLGTFYRRPAPGDPLFVEPGSAVEPDTVVGIVEVMKLMNHVTADTSGRVERVLVEEGELVEYDQPLLLIRTS